MTTQWYKHLDSDYICGINGNITPRALADCLSAHHPIPLQAEAEFTETGFTVGAHEFAVISQPPNYHQYDLFLGQLGE